MNERLARRGLGAALKALIPTLRSMQLINLKTQDFDSLTAALAPANASRVAVLKLFASVFAHLGQSRTHPEGAPGTPTKWRTAMPAA